MEVVFCAIEVWALSKLPWSEAFLNQFWRKEAEEHCWLLPSPKRMFPAPAVFPAVCSFADHCA